MKTESSLVLVEREEAELAERQSPPPDQKSMITRTNFNIRSDAAPTNPDIWGDLAVGALRAAPFNPSVAMVFLKTYVAIGGGGK